MRLIVKKLIKVFKWHPAENRDPKVFIPMIRKNLMKSNSQVADSPGLFLI